MTTLQNKQILGYSVVKREKITPSGKMPSAQNSARATVPVKVAAKKVIKTHRDVLVALRDR